MMSSQTKESAIDAWDAVRRWGHPGVINKMEATPIFRDSMEFMPLQAADMLAHWIREWQLAPGKYGNVEVKYPWAEKKKMKSFHIFYDKEKLINNFRDTFLVSLLRRYNLLPSVVSYVVSRRLASSGRSAAG